jgi:hypothetical protein
VAEVKNSAEYELSKGQMSMSEGNNVQRYPKYYY